MDDHRRGGESTVTPAQRRIISAEVPCEVKVSKQAHVSTQNSPMLQLGEDT
jgi:hypothetical protein